VPPLKARSPRATFEIRVRADGAGFSLSSAELLSRPLWYRELGDAVSYARDRGKRHETTIRVFNRAGELVKERTFPAGDILY
jgi:hypothetical protein